MNARIEGIDVLRGLAALMVVFSHYIPFWDKYLTPPIPVFIPNQFGYYAVELFFVISGIVIFSTLDKCKSTTQFLFMRISRLYPVYLTSLWFVALVSFLVFQQPIWLTGLIVNSTMFQEFVGFNNIDNVYWSLTVELAFYLNVAWLFTLGWHKYRVTVCAVWLLFACIWKLTQSTAADNERDVFALLFALDYAHFFVVGITLHDAIKNGIRKTTYLLLIGALVTSFIIAGLEGFVITSIVTTLASLALSGRLNFTVNPITLWLGNISFSLYLIHRNLGYSLLPELHKLGISPFFSILITVSMALVLATVLTYFVERPALHYLRIKSYWGRR